MPNLAVKHLTPRLANDKEDDMKAYEVQNPGDEWVTEISQVSAEPTGAEVVVTVHNSGVCHTDIHLAKGGYDLPGGEFLSMADRGVVYPMVMGHEISGTVNKVGPNVTDLQVGDTVVVYPWLGCGECESCETGAENLCSVKLNAIGIARPGGYAREVVVPHEKYCVNLQGLDPVWGSTLACSGITSYSAVRRVLPKDPEVPVLVCGAGGVGLTAIAMLSAQGHKNIMVIDRNSTNFSLAKEHGARLTVETNPSMGVAELREALGARPLAILDFVNSGETAQTHFDLLAKGGTMVQVGLFGGGFTISTALLTLQQRSIIGSYVGSLGDLQDVVQLALDGRIPRPPIETQKMSERKLNDALTRLADGKGRGRLVLQQ